MKMEEKEEGKPANGMIGDHWGWAAAGATQFVLGILAFRKGYSGDSNLMPFKAFAVASLFVGAAATSATASLRASGVRSVDDMKALGEDIRSNLGLQPRPRSE
ncbi:uncharacterized protein LOC127250535 [Andrographis paniculata]|uniref:uncharacterized protein LOC127250535 n=1 Tax=Andrographis paniculata TaxID=175694 RepID=UPI0021E957C9|nr:uncharacterized protein LOC127250535 [Andrographis paniculata]